MSKTRWNYDLVSEFINDNSNCTLISTEFKTAKTKMLFICTCGNQFNTTFEKFRLRDKRQCNDCGFKAQLEKQSLSFEEVNKFVNENSNCTLLSESYKNTKTNLKFKCKCGEIFHKTFEKFKKSLMCKECSYEQISISQTFDYSFVKYYIESKSCEILSRQYNSCEDLLDIKCSCGEIYMTTFNSFKNENQIRCKRCTNKMSKGEILIEEYLRSNRINYETQFTFDNLKAFNNKQKLKFDFAIFMESSLYCLIEFDGKQHDNPVEYFGGNESFEILKYNDTKKNEYCLNNNIKLIRIPYKQMKNIENILYNSLNINNDNTVPSLVHN